MASLAEVSDGMAQVNGEPVLDICYVAARGGHQIDSGDQLLRDVAVAWADEDKDKFFLLQLVMDGGAWLVGNDKLLIPGGEAVLARLQEWAVTPSVLHLFACWRAAPTAENMLDLLDLVISIIVDTRAIDLGRAAPLRLGLALISRFFLRNFGPFSRKIFFAFFAKLSPFFPGLDYLSSSRTPTRAFKCRFINEILTIFF